MEKDGGGGDVVYARGKLCTYNKERTDLDSKGLESSFIELKLPKRKYRYLMSNFIHILIEMFIPT